MRASISRTFGGGAAKVESENTMNCNIDCGFSVSNNRIDFSFPFVINGKNFNYRFTLDLDPGDLYFNKPAMLETVMGRAQEILAENFGLALRETMVSLAETSLFGAGIKVQSTKAKMTA